SGLGKACPCDVGTLAADLHGRVPLLLELLDCGRFPRVFLVLPRETRGAVIIFRLGTIAHRPQAQALRTHVCAEEIADGAEDVAYRAARCCKLTAADRHLNLSLIL